MKLHTVWMAAALGLGLVWANAALAAPITGSSSGVFSNLSNCDMTGSNRECGIVSSSNGANTQVRWPYLDGNDEINNASSLTAVTVNINTATNANDLVIGRIDWFNASTSSDITPDSLGVTWTLTIAFSNPNVSIDTEAFGLSIINTDNPSGDSISGLLLANLSHLSFALNGWTIDDFRYSVIDGAGECQGTDTSLSGSSWFNCENNTASLLITADFTAASAVSEPASLAILAAGLLGLGVLYRRKKSSRRRFR